MKTHSKILIIVGLLIFFAVGTVSAATWIPYGDHEITNYTTGGLTGTVTVIVERWTDEWLQAHPTISGEYANWTNTDPTNISSLNIFIVGGGGAGGRLYPQNPTTAWNYAPGGGGGGGYVMTALTDIVGPYTIHIGKGGTEYILAESTTWGAYTAYGGGKGGTFDFSNPYSGLDVITFDYPPGNGASGGGAASLQASPGLAVHGDQGYKGGIGGQAAGASYLLKSALGGGGGGAKSEGGTAVSTYAGYGGLGVLTTFAGVPELFGGGGGGAVFSSEGLVLTSGVGGDGGGGDGQGSNDYAWTYNGIGAGTPGTGGGGGAGDFRHLIVEVMEEVGSFIYNI